MLRIFEDSAIEFRQIMELPVSRSEFDSFKPLSFSQLAQMIRNTYDNIHIFEETTADAYMIKYDDTEQYDGCNDNFNIFIGQFNDDERISALVHELAHVFFHRKEIPYNVPIGSNLGTWEQEIEANYFSRAFLVPEALFMKALSIFSRNDGTVDLDGFAERFNVGKNVIVSRGNDLKIW